jgi:hypothetical protein
VKAKKLSRKLQKITTSLKDMGKDYDGPSESIRDLLRSAATAVGRANRACRLEVLEKTKKGRTGNSSRKGPSAARKSVASAKSALTRASDRRTTASKIA